MLDPQVRRLADGRIHALYGPTDLIITIDGSPEASEHAASVLGPLLHEVLSELADNLEVLRLPVPRPTSLGSSATGHMIRAANAVGRHGPLTPMAAVAGAVADVVCAALWRPGMGRLIVNNGGDIAFELADGESLVVGLADIAGGSLSGGLALRADVPVRGVATSGRRGRSLTLGIADSVTTFAANAATADAAATIIASAVDLPNSPKVTRCDAGELDASSDLVGQLVVVDVDALSEDEQRAAVEGGAAVARSLVADRQILGAVIRVGDTDELVAEQLGILRDAG